METVILNVGALMMVHDEKHEACAYQPAMTAEITVRVHGDAVAPVAGEVPGAAVFSVQLAEKDLVYVHVDPKTPDLHVIDGIFEYAGRGRLTRIEASAADFAPPQGIVLDGNPLLLGLQDLLPDLPRAVMLMAYLSPLKDTTPRVRQAISDGGGFFDEGYPEDMNVLDYPPVLQPGGAIRYTPKMTVEAGAKIVGFELAGGPKQVPKLIATSWPYDDSPLAGPFDASENYAFLYFIHPTLGQNDGYYRDAAYPYSYAYSFDAGMKYLGMGFENVPIDVYDNKGLAHQVSAGGRKVAVVMPVHKVYNMPENGRFADADYVAMVFHEIHAFWARTRGVYLPPPQLGDCAIGAFSSGNELMASFLNTNKAKHLCDECILHVIACDPPSSTGAMDAICAATNAWMARGSRTDDKRFRLYSQERWNAQFSQFLPSKGAAIPTAPFTLPGDDPYSDEPDFAVKKSLVVLPPEDLAKAADALDPPNPPAKKPRQWGYWDAHALIPALAVVDAMRRSILPLAQAPSPNPPPPQPGGHIPPLPPPPDPGPVIA